MHVWAGAPYSWTINPVTPPYYEAVAVQHGYLRVEANRTALTMQACPELPECLRMYIILGLLLYSEDCSACMLAGRRACATLCSSKYHP